MQQIHQSMNTCPPNTARSSFQKGIPTNRLKHQPLSILSNKTNTDTVIDIFKMISPNRHPRIHIDDILIDTPRIHRNDILIDTPRIHRGWYVYLQTYPILSATLHASFPAAQRCLGAASTWATEKWRQLQREEEEKSDLGFRVGTLQDR